MKSNKVIVETGNAIYANIMDALVKVEAENKELLEGVAKDDFQTALSKLDTLTKCIATAIGGTFVDGVSLPQFLYTVTAVEETPVKEVTVTVKSKLKATNRIKEDKVIAVDADFVENVANLMLDTVYTMYYNEAAEENVEALNAKLEEIFGEAGIEKKFKFAVTTDSSRVVSIDNDTVVIKAQVDAALNISEQAIMALAGYEDEAEIPEFDQLCYNGAKDKLVSVMRTIQITPEILKKKIALVEELGNLHTKKYAYKLIREGYHRKAENLKDVKAGVGYFNAEVDGVDVFALVETDESGVKVVLDPFDTKTNISVDCDVLAQIA